MPSAVAQRDAIVASIDTTITELMSIDNTVNSLGSSVVRRVMASISVLLK